MSQPENPAQGSGDVEMADASNNGQNGHDGGQSSTYISYTIYNNNANSTLNYSGTAIGNATGTGTGTGSINIGNVVQLAHGATLAAVATSFSNTDMYLAAQPSSPTLGQPELIEAGVVGNAGLYETHDGVEPETLPVPGAPGEGAGVAAVPIATDDSYAEVYADAYWGGMPPLEVDHELPATGTWGSGHANEADMTEELEPGPVLQEAEPHIFDIFDPGSSAFVNDPQLFNPFQTTPLAPIVIFNYTATADHSPAGHQTQSLDNPFSDGYFGLSFAIPQNVAQAAAQQTPADVPGAAAGTDNSGQNSGSASASAPAGAASHLATTGDTDSANENQTMATSDSGADVPALPTVPAAPIMPTPTAVPNATFHPVNLASFLTSIGASPDAVLLDHTLLPPLSTQTHPFSNLRPSNQDMRLFLTSWVCHCHNPNIPRKDSSYPLFAKCDGVRKQLTNNRHLVRYQDLHGDNYDLQGIDWTTMGVTRRHARQRRSQIFRNYVSTPGADRHVTHRKTAEAANTESYFRFRKMVAKKPLYMAHFQLRNLLACTSRSAAFYVDGGGVVRKMNMQPTGPKSARADADPVALRFVGHSNVQISTIATGYDVMVAGGFGGEYCIANLHSEYVGEKPLVTRGEGDITSQSSGITNHIEVHGLRNTAGPLATFASNDCCVRLFDINTERVLSSVNFDFAINCTAISPDRRLRVVVGDCKEAYIVAAEPERWTAGTNGLRKPDVLHCLKGHKDFGFACAWADDGYTVATGNQDRVIKVWDARRLVKPVHTLRTEMAGARSLRFSPVGSGKCVLVAAEEADFINIFDAASYQTKQTIDLFGEISGLSFTNGGQDLMALCADKLCGGLLHFERCSQVPSIYGVDEDIYNPVLRARHWRVHSNVDWQGMNDPKSRSMQQTRARRHMHAAAARGVGPF